MKIGVIIAMDIEYRQMCAALGGKAQGQLGNNHIVLAQCGIGKVNAAVGTMRMVQQHAPDCIVSTGLAGGIDASLQVMDVMVASQAVYHDVWCGMGCQPGQVQGQPTRFDAHPAMVSHAMSLAPEAEGRVVQGLICTGDQFITDRTALDRIKAAFADGLACDMESAAIAHTCRLLEVPFMSLRVISDTPGNTDNHQQQWDQFLASMCDRSFNFVSRFLSTLQHL